MAGIIVHVHCTFIMIKDRMWNEVNCVTDRQTDRQVVIHISVTYGMSYRDTDIQTE